MTPSTSINAPAHDAPAHTRRSRWIIAAAVLCFLIAGLLLPLISLGRYHRTIADSLSRSLGHTVHLGSVNLAIFPLPGLVIHDLTVEENPSFGAEPLLRAPTVTVFLRVSSLWRQRLEISRIDLDSASVNLARDPSGSWNFSSLLLQASRTNTAPTAQRRPSATPRFPYIAFNGARINFKEGVEKKAFSFLNADASIWLADPNQWRIRFAAQPARTDLDLDLADTGIIRVEGSLTRAPSLDQLPLDLHVEWTGAQLGQVSRLMLGSDSGWRGDLRASADIAGTMRDLELRSHLGVAGAHRLEFTPAHPLDIDARCNATWRRPARLLEDITCLLPTGDGHLLLTGSVQDLAHPRPRLSLEINHTPADFLVSILGLVRSTLPPALSATGTINGQFSWAPAQAPSPGASTGPNTGAESPGDRNLLTGHAVAENVSINLSDSAPPITFAALRFATPQVASLKSKRASSHSQIRVRSRVRVPQVSILRPGIETNTIVLEPATFSLGAPTPMRVSGQFSRSGFLLHITGESSLARLQPIARSLAQLHAVVGLTPAAPAAKAIAQSDLNFSGPWFSLTSETGAATTALLHGWTRIQHAQFSPSWLPEPIEIASATAQFGDQLTPNAIAWTNATISVNGIEAKGSATWPTSCEDPVGCPARLDLDFPTLDAAALQSSLLGAGPHGEFLQAILSTVESPAPPWPPLDVTLHVATLSAGKLRFSDARAALSVRDNRLTIRSLNADTLGGSAHITGSISPSSDGPLYALNLAFTGIKLPNAAALFAEKRAPDLLAQKSESGSSSHPGSGSHPWGTGSIDGQMTLRLRGYSDLAESATGDFSFILNGEWGGSWTTAQIENEPASASLNILLPLPSPTPHLRKSAHPAQWNAAGTIANQTLTFTRGPARGTIAFERTLDLLWTGNPRTGNRLPAPALAAIQPRPKASSAPANPAAPSPAFQITGTLARPLIQTASQLRPSRTNTTAPIGSR